MGLTSTTPAAGGRLAASWGQEVANSGFIDEAFDTGTKTLSDTTTWWPATSGGCVTFVVARSRRYKITVAAVYRLGTSAVGRVTIAPSWSLGTTPITPQVLDPFTSVRNDSGVSGSGGGNGGMIAGTVVLDPGTYTACAVVKRTNGGDASDVATAFYCLVEDIGAP